MIKAGENLGIPSNLWDDQIVLASSMDLEGAEELMAMSREVFLDTVTCSDENTRHLYEAVNRKSRALANRSEQ